MKGQNLILGSSFGEGELYFSDGTIQTTAYTGETVDGSTTLTIDNLTVNQSETVGSSESKGSLTIYGSVSQILTDISSTSYGNNTLNNISTGTENTAFGSVCLNNLSTGIQNCAMGNATLQNLTSGNLNTAVGSGVMTSSTITSGNTCLGANSGGSISTTQNYNTCIGVNSDSSYSYSTCIGYNSKAKQDHEIVLGSSSEIVNIPNLIYQYLPNSNTSFGYESLTQTGSVLGNNNSSFGYESLAVNQGNYNCSFGDYSLASNTSGQLNVSIGHFGAIYNTTGSQNVNIGANSLQNCKTSSNNTIIGYDAASLITDNENNNTCIGYQSGVSSGVSFSTAIGSGVIAENSHEIVLGSSNESVIINGNLLTNGVFPSSTTTLNLGSTSNTVSIPGNLSVGSANNGLSNNIYGTNNTFYASSTNTFQSTVNSFVGTNNFTSGPLNVSGSTTFNSSANFNNGLSCSGFLPYNFIFGSATFSSINNSGNYQTTTYSDGSTAYIIPPYSGSIYGDGNAYYDCDQQVPSTILTAFLNSNNTNFIFWYVSYNYVILTTTSGACQLYTSFVNLTTDNQILPEKIYYLAFIPA